MIELPRACLVADRIAPTPTSSASGPTTSPRPPPGSRATTPRAASSTSTSSAACSTGARSNRSTRRASGRWSRSPPSAARETKADLSLGICGEHGGDPESIRFFERVGLDYVSCSPYRVPIARVAAAQAALAAGGRRVSDRPTRTLRERFVRLCEIAEPDRLRARGRRRRAGRAARARGRGRARTTRPSRRAPASGQPDRAGPGDGRAVGRRSSPTSTRSRSPGAIEVELADGVFRSRGETILGADNKAAVAVLVELAARHAALPARRPGSSSCSRSPRRTACAAPRSSTWARCGRRSATCSTTRARSAR